MESWSRRRGRALITLTLVASLAIPATPTRAAGQVGDGTPASCTEAAFDTAFAGGGVVTFNCGSAPHTIVFTSRKIPAAGSTTVDGSGTITLSGNDSTRLFAVSAGSALTLTNLVLTNARPNDSAGGGAINNAGTVVIENSTVQSSTVTLVPRRGGAIYNGPNGVLDVRSSAILTNSAGEGGGIWSSGVVSVTNSVLRRNTGSSGGGLFLEGGRALLVASQILTNTGGSSGGGITSLSGQLTIEGSQILSNTAGAGAGISVAQGDSTLSSSTVAYNRAAFYGGGIASSSRMTIERSTIVANSAQNGGGVDHDGGLQGLLIRSSTLVSNVASLNGGGLRNTNSTGTRLENSTIGGNSAERGGGLYQSDSTATSLRNVTIAENGSTMPGTSIVVALGGSISVTQSIVTSNHPNQLCVVGGGGTIISTGFNYSNGGTCNFTQPTDLQGSGVDVKLGPLADNGGPTLTHYPAADSPVRNGAGPAACLPFDQRGARRPRETACDSGSVEYGAGPTLSSLVPPSADTGSAPFSLTLLGADFILGAAAEWNGSPRPTTYISSSQLAASIAASDVAGAGTAQVRVRNPGPGDGVSGELPFTIADATATPTATSTVPPGSTATPTATVPPGSTATPTATAPPGSTVSPTASVPPGSTATPTVTSTPPAGTRQFLAGTYLNVPSDG